jgi:hypothetical protein
MIKLVSFFVFLGAFIWTWFLFNSNDKVDLSVHAGIQSRMMVLIEDAIKASRPNSTEFEIINIYTKKINDNQISAHFTYKYSDQLEEKETTTQIIAGEAILNRTPSENANEQKWVVQSVKTDTNKIEFQGGLIVTNEPLNPENPSNPSVPAEEKKTE